MESYRIWPFVSDVFYVTWSLQGSSRWWQLLELHWAESHSVVRADHMAFTHAYAHAHRLFPPFPGYCEQCCNARGGQVPVWFFWVPRGNGVAESYGNFLFNFSRSHLLQFLKRIFPTWRKRTRQRNHTWRARPASEYVLSADCDFPFLSSIPS